MKAITTYDILDQLVELRDDGDLSRKFREKTEIVIALLSAGRELSIEKALLELEELNALGMPPYHRTKVWDIIGMLESINN